MEDMPLNSCLRYMTGGFDYRELKAYLIFLSAVFWGLIFLAWLSYPAENRYSIMTHTFSFLGSFETKHNPEWWWIFSMAMTFWGLATIPLTCYIFRRFRHISFLGAMIGAFLFLCGGVGLIGVAFFPDARGAVIASWEWTEIHEKAAVLTAIGFGLGFPWHGILLIKQRFSQKRIPYRFQFHRFVLPYAFWGSIFCVAAYFLGKWEFVYAEMKANARATGESIGSSWSEAMNTIYSFPLWENILIYAMFIFLLWFTLTLPNEENARAGDSATH
jgi:hypothetical protein